MERQDVKQNDRTRMAPASAKMRDSSFLSSDHRHRQSFEAVRALAREVQALNQHMRGMDMSFVFLLNNSAAASHKALPTSDRRLPLRELAYDMVNSVNTPPRDG